MADLAEWHRVVGNPKVGMTSGTVAIIGTGPRARLICEVVSRINAAGGDLTVVGCVAEGDHESRWLDAMGLARLEDLTSLSSHATSYVVAEADPSRAQQLDERARLGGCEAAVLVDPQAVICDRVLLGPGTVVGPFAVISIDVTMGRGCWLSALSIVGHGVVVGSAVTIGERAQVSGETSCGDRVVVEAAATVLQNLTIGSDVVVGGNSMVVRDVGSGMTVVGVPAVER